MSTKNEKDYDGYYLDLKGEICPAPVVAIVSIVETMEKGETRVFIIDDPLAIKSVPEELEELGVEKIVINKWLNGWQIKITK